MSILPSVSSNPISCPSFANATEQIDVELSMHSKFVIL